MNVTSMWDCRRRGVGEGEGDFFFFFFFFLFFLRSVRVIDFHLLVSVGSPREVPVAEELGIATEDGQFRLDQVCWGWRCWGPAGWIACVERETVVCKVCGH